MEGWRGWDGGMWKRDRKRQQKQLLLKKLLWGFCHFLNLQIEKQVCELSGYPQSTISVSLTFKAKDFKMLKISAEGTRVLQLVIYQS